MALGGASKSADVIVRALVWGIGIILLYILIKKLYTKFLRRNAGKAYVNGDNLDASTNYDNIAKECHDTFDIFFTSGEELSSLCSQLLSLNDDEIGQVNNRYLLLYGNNTKTLQDSILGGFWGAPPGNSPCGKLLERLSKMNLN